MSGGTIDLDVEIAAQVALQPTVAAQVVLAPSIGTAGVQGVQGPVGPPGVSGDLNFRFQQEAAAMTWIIGHNLGKYPSVTVIDTAGTQVEGDITYIDQNNVTLNFTAPFSGVAYLN